MLKWILIIAGAIVAVSVSMLVYLLIVGSDDDEEEFW